MFDYVTNDFGKKRFVINYFGKKMELSIYCLFKSNFIVVLFVLVR